MIARLRASVWALLLSIDILACTLWLAPLHVFGLADRPTGRMMISSYVGRAAHNGMRWGLIAAAVIDWLACRCGALPDHCERTWRFYHGKDD